MKYKYRWWYVLILSVVIFSFAIMNYLKPQYERLKHLQQSIAYQKIKLSTLHNIKKLRAPSPLVILKESEKVYFNDLFNLARQYDLKIHSISYLPKSKSDTFLVSGSDTCAPGSVFRLLLIGNYIDILKFLTNMVYKNYSITLLEYNFSEESHVIKLSIIFAAQMHSIKYPKNLDLNSELHNNIEQIATISEPFCFCANPFKQQLSSSHNLTSFPLAQFKMSGFFQDDNYTFALLTSPNNEINEISVGSFIGVEYAQVLSIAKSNIRLKLKDGNQQIIQMQQEL